MSNIIKKLKPKNTAWKLYKQTKSYHYYEVFKILRSEINQIKIAYASYLHEINFNLKSNPDRFDF